MLAWKQQFMGLVSVTVMCGMVGLVLPPHTQAVWGIGGSKILSSPCGSLILKHKRFVISPKNPGEVCDNTTGRHWQQSPNTGTFSWQDAIDHCASLPLNGKTWRLAKVKELISLRNTSNSNQVAALNFPNGPFMDVKAFQYWSADRRPDSAWQVYFNDGDRYGDLELRNPNVLRLAWCVR